MLNSKYKVADDWCNICIDGASPHDYAIDKHCKVCGQYDVETGCITMKWIGGKLYYKPREPGISRYIY